MMHAKSQSSVIVYIALASLFFIIAAVVIAGRFHSGTNPITKIAPKLSTDLDKDSMFNLIRRYIDTSEYDDAASLADEYTLKFPKSKNIDSVYYLKFYSYLRLYKFKNAMEYMKSLALDKEYKKKIDKVSDLKTRMLFELALLPSFTETSANPQEQKPMPANLIGLFSAGGAYFSLTQNYGMSWPGLDSKANVLLDYKAEPFYLAWWIALEKTGYKDAGLLKQSVESCILAVRKMPGSTQVARDSFYQISSIGGEDYARAIRDSTFNIIQKDYTANINSYTDVKSTEASSSGGIKSKSVSYIEDAYSLYHGVDPTLDKYLLLALLRYNDFQEDTADIKTGELKLIDNARSMFNAGYDSLTSAACPGVVSGFVFMIDKAGTSEIMDSCLAAARQKFSEAAKLADEAMAGYIQLSNIDSSYMINGKPSLAAARNGLHFSYLVPLYYKIMLLNDTINLQNYKDIRYPRIVYTQEIQPCVAGITDNYCSIISSYIERGS